MSISEGIGSNLRPQITWNATNTGTAPVEITNSGEIFIGPFSASATITHVAILTTSGTVSAGQVIAVATISSKAVVAGDRLRFAAGSIKLTVT